MATSASSKAASNKAKPELATKCAACGCRLGKSNAWAETTSAGEPVGLACAKCALVWQAGFKYLSLTEYVAMAQTQEPGLGV